MKIYINLSLTIVSQEETKERAAHESVSNSPKLQVIDLVPDCPELSIESEES